MYFDKNLIPAGHSSLEILPESLPTVSYDDVDVPSNEEREEQVILTDSVHAQSVF